jgi:putative ABC transport system substrate-binding protein
MESLSDVVSIGLVSSLARPGGNITGVSGFAPELSGKRLELIREIFPRADRIAVLANRANPVTVPILRATESAAQQIRMKLHVVDVRQPAELGAAFERMRREHTDALVLVADPLLFTERPLIIQLAARHRLPAVYETRLFPETGGLLSYGPLPQERFKRMAVYVDRILRGAQPGELPVERPTTFELVITSRPRRRSGSRSRCRCCSGRIRSLSDLGYRKRRSGFSTGRGTPSPCGLGGDCGQTTDCDQRECSRNPAGDLR